MSIRFLQKQSRFLCCLAISSLALSLISISAQASSKISKSHNASKSAAGFLGMADNRWPKDFGVMSGHCDREAISSVLAGAVGGALGSPIMRGDNHATAILVGNTLSAALTEKLGKDLDLGDRACLGHSLELAKNKHNVAWTNNISGVRYVFTPTKTLKEKTAVCREYSLQASTTTKKLKTTGKACRAEAGEWTVEEPNGK